MYSIDSVQFSYGPRKEIAAKLPELESLIFMYEWDSAFLCGLLEMQKPKKVLEVGIANGATTAVIMQCMQRMGLMCEIHSTDIRTIGFDGSNREVGFLGSEASALLGFEGYHLYKGASLPTVIDQIGAGIDFLILDTTHKVPGEILDFLVAFPYLTDDAMVVLHDIRHNHKSGPAPHQIGTNALFNSIAADKFVCSDESREPDYPNTGAFQVNADTATYITNVFGMLTLNWPKPLADWELAGYTAAIHAHYSEEACWIYDRAVEMNRLSLAAVKPQKPTLAQRIRSFKGGTKRRG